MARVPNTTSFSLNDVVNIVNQTSPGQPKIQRLYKSTSAVDVSVSCNGYTHVMYWTTDVETTLWDFAFYMEMRLEV